MSNVITINSNGTLKPAKPRLYVYCPEMGEKEPDCQLEAIGSWDGVHYYVNAPLDLAGRGIERLQPHCGIGPHKDAPGWKAYRVTYRAFDKLKKTYSIKMESMLD